MSTRCPAWTRTASVESRSDDDLELAGSPTSSSGSPGGDDRLALPEPPQHDAVDRASAARWRRPPPPGGRAAAPARAQLVLAPRDGDARRPRAAPPRRVRASASRASRSSRATISPLRPAMRCAAPRLEPRRGSRDRARSRSAWRRLQRRAAALDARLGLGPACARRAGPGAPGSSVASDGLAAHDRIARLQLDAQHAARRPAPRRRSARARASRPPRRRVTCSGPRSTAARSTGDRARARARDQRATHATSATAASSRFEIR